MDSGASDSRRKAVFWVSVVLGVLFIRVLYGNFALAQFLIDVPLLGILVRFRANYNPKAAQSDEEARAQLPASPVVNSYVGMMWRVYNLEGWLGLYKGLMPALASFVSAKMFWFLFRSTVPRSLVWDIQTKLASVTLWPVGEAAYSIASLAISLPVTVITYRAITTPHTLPWLAPTTALHALLTPAERQQPWTLLRAPGLVASSTGSTLLATVAVAPLRAHLLTLARQPEPDAGAAARFGAAYLAFLALGTAALCPLEVVRVRAALQRAREEPRADALAEGEGKGPVAEGAVICLRSDDEPYLGLFDCAARIVREEGLRTLYRGWWATFFWILAGDY